MTSLLGGVAGLFGGLLSSTYFAGTITKRATSYNAQGDIARTGTAFDCRVQVDSATEKMRQTDGFTETDQAVYVLADGLSIALDTDCQIAIEEGPYAGQTFDVAAPIDRDPGGAYWRCRGTVAT